jgi:hypothetical protein
MNQENEHQWSGPEQGEVNLAKVKAYFAELEATGQSVPMEDGHPNISAISKCSKVPRNAFYANKSIKNLLREKLGGQTAEGDGEGGLHAHCQAQLESKDRQIAHLEQLRALAQAEIEELRKLYADAKQQLLRYQFIEEEVLVSGRRIIP